LAGGYEIRGSTNHPVFCELDGDSTYRTLADLENLPQADLQRIRFRLHGEFDWESEPIVYRIPTTSEHTTKTNGIRDRLGRFRNLPVSEASKLAGINYRTTKSNLGLDAIPDFQITIDEEMGYFLGVMIGDGCLCAEHAHALFSSLDGEIVDQVISTVRTRFEGTVSKRSAKCDWEIHSRTVRDLFHSLGLSVKSQFKFIPDIIIESPKPVIRAFLSGLFDTDGTAAKNGYASFATTSERMSYQVQQLLLLFGIFCNRRFKQNSFSGCWIIDVNGHARRFYERIGFRLTRKQIGLSRLPENKNRSQRYRDMGNFFQVPAVSIRECPVDLYDVTVPKHSNFIGNGLINHNTWSCVHRICRHLWETPGARVAFFAKSVKLAKDGGVWQDLLELAVPEWVDSGIGFEFTTKDSNGMPGPKQDAQTRTAYFRIRNVYGGESEIKLFSIEHDAEVASKVKGKRFSMIFFSELSMFKDKRILTVSLPQLRMPHLMPEPGKPDTWQQWLADTNPDEEEGNRSWFYDLWYVERMKKDHKYPNFQSSLGLIEMFIEDNPFVTPEELEELQASCDGDPALEDSYVRGIHGDGARKRDRFFSGHFSRAIHVIGGEEGQSDQIDVHDTSHLLMTGWDLGGKNHAAVILEPWYRPVPDASGKPVVRPCFSVLDELVVLGEEIRMDEFTELFLEKMQEIERKWNRKFQWEHWSDDSATNVYRPNTGTYDYMEIQAASSGLILLQGVMKPVGSVAARVRIVKMLLRQRRLWISARCIKTVKMMEQLRKGDTQLEYVMRDDNKHVFDALTYPIYMTVIDELTELSVPRASSDTHEDVFASVT